MIRSLTQLLLVLAPAVLAVDALRADEPLSAADEFPDRVMRLVTDLEAERRTVRRRAERALVELGPAILEHLPPLDRLPNASVREAVRRVRVVLERRRAEQSVRATRITGSGERPLRAWLEDWERATGNRLDVSALDPALLGTDVAYDLENVPFWTVLDESLRGHGIGLGGATSGSVTLVPIDEATVPVRVANVGAFRVSLESLRRRPLFGRDGEDLLRATLSVRAEPRLRPLFLRYTGTSTTVTGPVGELPPLDAEAKVDVPLARGAGSPRIDVRIPSSDDETTVSLAGRMTVTVAAGEEVIRFPPLDETGDVARRRGGVTVRVTEAAVVGAGDDRRAEVAISVAYDTGGPAFESHRSWVFENRAVLVGPDDARIPYRSPATTTREADGAIAIRYRFPLPEGDPGDFRLEYAAPTLILDVPLEFDWDDLTVGALEK